MTDFLIIFFTETDMVSQGDIGAKLSKVLEDLHVYDDFGGKTFCIFFNELEERTEPAFEKKETKGRCRLILVWDMEPNNAIKSPLKECIEKAGEVAIALHDRSPHRGRQKSDIKDLAGDKPIYPSEYFHDLKNDTYRILTEVLKLLPNKREYEESLQSLLKEIKKNIIKPLSAFKQHMAHLFLSMDVDLQGIGILRNQIAKGGTQNLANSPEAYLKDVLEEKEKTYYRQKIADLQFLVAKVSKGEEKPVLKCDGKPSGEPVMLTLSESNLPDDKAIVDLILEEKRNDYSVILFWSALLNLSGLKPEDRKKPFKNIIPDTDSSIFKFMCLMDCKIDKKNNISEDDVNDVMHFFAKIEGDKGRTVDVANVSPISSFHDWFCALVDCLEKLRKVIKPG
jgi:hypothetical protein